MYLHLIKNNINENMAYENFFVWYFKRKWFSQKIISPGGTMMVVRFAASEIKNKTMQHLLFNLMSFSFWRATFLASV